MYKESQKKERNGKKMNFANRKTVKLSETRKRSRDDRVSAACYRGPIGSGGGRTREEIRMDGRERDGERLVHVWLVVFQVAARTRQQVSRTRRWAEVARLGRQPREVGVEVAAGQVARPGEQEQEQEVGVAAAAAARADRRNRVARGVPSAASSVGTSTCFSSISRTRTRPRTPSTRTISTLNSPKW